MEQSPLPTRKGERTAQRILDAAESIFAEKGYAGATLRDVATAVGIRTPSLYNHFPSKESLYAAVLERGLSPVLELLAEFANPQAATGEPRELIERVMKFLVDSPNLPRLILHETLAGGERLTPELRAWIGPIFEQANHIAEEAGTSSDRSREQIPLLVVALYNIVLGYFAIAPLYQQLNGRDLMSESLRLQQIEIITDLAKTLFPRSQPPTRAPERTPLSETG
jgi:TetR/AcrR family transcriptional regulator